MDEDFLGYEPQESKGTLIDDDEIEDPFDDEEIPEYDTDGDIEV